MLTAQDIDLLLAAIDSWERELGQKSMMSGLLTAVFVKDEAKAEASMAEQAARAEAETNRRKRQAILLKAKLVQMADESAPDQLFSRVITAEA